MPSNVDKHIYPDEIQVSLCNYTDVYYNEVIASSELLKAGSCNQSEYNKFALKKGDVIITKDSESADDIGIPCFIDKDLPDTVCGYHLTLIRPTKLQGEYLFRFIESERTRRYFEVSANGITRFGLGKATVENLVIPVPPSEEQSAISCQIDEQSNFVSKSIELGSNRIQKLKEYRQALISEVVTGKLKVSQDD